jgi:hypothetical protein
LQSKYVMILMSIRPEYHKAPYSLSFLQLHYFFSHWGFSLSRYGMFHIHYHIIKENDKSNIKGFLDGADMKGTYELWAGLAWWRKSPTSNSVHTVQKFIM